MAVKVRWFQPTHTRQKHLRGQPVCSAADAPAHCNVQYLPQHIMKCLHQVVQLALCVFELDGHRLDPPTAYLQMMLVCWWCCVCVLLCRPRRCQPDGFKGRVSVPVHPIHAAPSAVAVSASCLCVSITAANRQPEAAPASAENVGVFPGGGSAACTALHQCFIIAQCGTAAHQLNTCGGAAQPVSGKSFK